MSEFVVLAAREALAKYPFDYITAKKLARLFE
jgi:hypothetical protein